tara:strand:- start:1111 stop:1317 length:207 start_codon:yes stop_codon:yes gene_type:complete
MGAYDEPNTPQQPGESLRWEPHPYNFSRALHQLFKSGSKVGVAWALAWAVVKVAPMVIELAEKALEIE